MPTPDVSLVDLTAVLSRPTDADHVNGLLRHAAQGELRGILEVCELPLVSSDFRGSSASCIVDALSTMVPGGTLLKVLAWYDNEWGYSCRVVDLATHMARCEAIAA